MRKRVFQAVLLIGVSFLLAGCKGKDSLESSSDLFSKAKDEMIANEESALSDVIKRPGEMDLEDGRGSLTLYDGKKLTKFGHYNMDGNIDNGQEEIEWIVLAEKDDSYLLLSRYCFESVPFKRDYTEVKTWENSWTREYLNDEFYNVCFTESEKEKILLSKLENSPNPNGKGGCEDTLDYVFSLSLDELKTYYEAKSRDYYLNDRYFANEFLISEAALYTKDTWVTQNVSYRYWETNLLDYDFSADICGKMIASWALRTSDATGEGSMSVNRLGEVYFDMENNYVDYSKLIRPAMWVKKSSDFVLEDYVSSKKIQMPSLVETNPFSFLSFDDGEMKVSIQESIVEFCDEYEETIDFCDANGGLVFEIRPTRTSADMSGFYYDASSDTSLQIAARSDYVVKHELGYFTYTYSTGENENQLPDDTVLKAVVSYNCGNGREVSFDQSMVKSYNREEYRLALMDLEMQDVVFRYDEDKDRMSPTTDDYKIEYWEIPKMWKLDGFEAGYVKGFATYYGVRTSNNTMPAKYVRVTSYDEFGSVVNVRERLSFQTQEDAYYTLAAGECCLFFQEYNGKNVIPSDYSPETLIEYINKTLLPERTKEITGLTIENKDCRFYCEIDNPNGGSKLADVFSLSLTTVNNPRESLRNPVISQDVVYAKYGTEKGTGIAKCSYSMPSNHCPNLLLGDKKPFKGNYIQEIYDNGYSYYKQDRTYLVPASDDYILFWDGKEKGDDNYEIHLVSFDENGQVIQNIQRGYKSWNTVNTMEDLYSNWVSEGASLLYVDDSYYYLDLLPVEKLKPYNKIHRLTLLIDAEFDNGSLNSPETSCSTSYSAYVNNPKLSDTRQMISFDMYPFDESLLTGMTKLSEDYYVSYNGDTSVSSFDGSKHYDVSYYKVTFYGELGNQLGEHSRELLVFRNESDAKAFEQDVLENRPLWEPERNGKNVCVNTNLDYESKLSCLIAKEHSSERDYFSMPYLTESQAEQFERSGWRVR